YFGIADMAYDNEINRKGLLYVDENKHVVRPKQAYYALQHLAAIFDDNIQKSHDNWVTYINHDQLALHSYESKNNGRSLFAIWNRSDVPTDSKKYLPCDFQIENCDLTNPVYVDLITGDVFKI